jgi:tRNA(fMet)-specific endonuclease VapC
MSRLLDTNIISLAMSAEPNVLAQLRRLDPGGAAMSAVTFAEIHYGLQRAFARQRGDQASIQRKQELFGRLMEHVDVLPWDREAAAAYADERVACERDGEALDQADLMILAHAASTGRILVTRDVALQRRDRKGPHRTRIIGW